MATKKKNPEKPSKTDLIREAIAAGHTAPAKIAAYVAETHKVKLDTKYISVVKSQIGKRGRGGNHQTDMDVEKLAMAFSLRSGGIVKAREKIEAIKGGDNLAIAFAIAMGGIDKAVVALDSLKLQV